MALGGPQAHLGGVLWAVVRILDFIPCAKGRC